MGYIVGEFSVDNHRVGLVGLVDTIDLLILFNRHTDIDF